MNNVKKLTEYYKRKILSIFSNNLLYKIIFYILVPILLVIFLENLLHFKKIPSYLIPLPSQIFKTIVHSRSILLPNALITIQEVMLSFFIGSLCGVILAIIFFYFEKIEKIMMPYIFTIQIFPKISLAPLLLLWLGFGILPKVAIGALMSLFPVLINMLTGLRSVSKTKEYLFNSLSANKVQKFFKLYIPNASPFIFTGLKVGILFSMIGVLVGEFISATKGLGYLIQISSYQMDLNLCFAAIILLTVIVVLIQFILNISQSYILRWQDNIMDKD